MPPVALGGNTGNVDCLVVGGFAPPPPDRSAGCWDSDPPLALHLQSPPPPTGAVHTVHVGFRLGAAAGRLHGPHFT